jgi:hypothetical protein
MHIAAQRVAWVWFSVDGTKERGFLMTEGQTRDLSARESIVIHSGDAGALLLSMDGGAAQPMGRNGAVLTREYKAGGEAAAAVRTDLPRAPSTPAAPEPAPAPAAPAPLPEPVPIAPSTPVALADAQRASALAAAALGDRLASPRDEIVRLHELWIAARSRGDYATMRQLSAPDFDLLDERAHASASAAAGSPIPVLENMHVDIWGDGAVLSGRIAGQPVGTSGRPGDSYLSEVWVRRDGHWLLLGVRLADAPQARLMTTGR